MDERITVASYAERWLAFAGPTLKPETVQKYERQLALYVLPRLGARALRDVGPGELWELLARLHDRLARDSVRNVCMVCSAMFESATREELVPRNPARGLSRSMKLTTPKRARGDRVKALSEGELRALLRAARVEAPRFAPLLTVMALTGLRPGEAAALRWEDVDLPDHALAVRRTRQRRLDDTLRLGPKSNVARIVDLADDACATLRAVPFHPSGWVFANPETGAPYDLTSMQRAFRRARDAARLPAYITPHCLRHTWATLQLQGGAPLFYVVRQLGHSTVELAVNTYARWLQPRDVALANRLAERLGGVRPSVC